MNDTSERLTKLFTVKSTQTVSPGEPFAFEISISREDGFTIQTSPSWSLISTLNPPDSEVTTLCSQGSETGNEIGEQVNGAPVASKQISKIAVPSFKVSGAAPVH